MIFDLFFNFLSLNLRMNIRKIINFFNIFRLIYMRAVLLKLLFF
jgi:hypothetical protein